MTAAQLGARSGAAVLGVGIAYAVVLGFGMLQYGAEPIGDPTLAVMELLTIASALPILALFVALHALAPEARRLWATLGLCFAAVFTAATTGVHVVELTAGRALGRHGLVWPSVTYAVELFAWDGLLGLALLCAAFTLTDAPRARRARVALRATGALCLVGLVGPLVGDMRLQLIGVFGYAVLLPVSAWLLAAWFRADGPGHPPPTA